jgi:chemotaxis response regulator CheB
MAMVKAPGGLTMAQDPAEAECGIMPQAAIDAGVVAEVLRAAEIGRRLVELGGRKLEAWERGRPARY